MWLLLAALAFAKPPRAPETAPRASARSEAAPAPPSDPGPIASPYEPPPITPGGSATALDLLTLARTTTRFRLDADVTPLDRVDAATAEILARQLAADPTWRLTSWDGALVAWRRVADPAGGWTVPLRGVHAEKDGTWRICLRFGAWAEGSVWRSPAVVRVPASSAFVEAISLHPKDRPLWSASAIAWEGPAAALEIYDASLSGDLSRTADALDRVPREVAGILADKSEVTSMGFSSVFLPRGEPAQGAPSIQIRSPGPGELDVRARVHASSRGFAWVRLLDAGGKPWEERAVGVGTREIPGWSANEADLFYLQGRFPVPPGPEFAGIAEVWFQPATGGTPARLSSTPITVPAR